MENLEQKEHKPQHDHFNPLESMQDDLFLSQYSFAESLHSSPLEIMENEQNTKTLLPDIIKESSDVQHENTITALANLSTTARNEYDNVQLKLYDFTRKSALKQYNKQLVQSRSVMYHQHNLRMLAENVITKPEEQRLFVIRKVARELWTNFCVRGQQSPMLDYLHEKLREMYNEDLQFSYKPGTTELIIMRHSEDKLIAVSKEEKVEMVNSAWKLAQEIVAKYTL